MRKISLLLVLLLLLACKNENKNSTTPIIVEEAELKDTFTLTINAVVEEDDKFILHFLEEGQTNITSQNSVVVNVFGSEQVQELTFKIKEEILPTRLFLMFGNEKQQQQIKFLTTKLSYGENSFIIQEDKFFQFFNPNKYIDYDVENSIATAKEVDGIYKPWFGSRTVLIDKIFYDF